jgi:hypothetical protein
VALRPGPPAIGGGSRVADVTGETATDFNDWRVTAHLNDVGQAQQAVHALSAQQVEAEIHGRLGGRVALGTDGARSVFLYTHTEDAAAAAQQVLSDLLTGHQMTADFTVDRWHPVAEEWEPADVPLPADDASIRAEREQVDVEETSESLASGHALYEVRVQLPSHHESVAFATRLAGEGYSVTRRWRFLVVGANNADQAEEFEAAIRREAPAGAQITVGEVGITPFTAFDLAADSGL